MDRLMALGVGLSSFGIPISLFSFFIFAHSGLFAFGLSIAILGGTMVLTPWDPVPEPPVMGMLEGSCVNVEALLEEFDCTERAIYLPPRDGRVYSYANLSSNPESPDLGKIMRAPKRVVTDAGGQPGLFVFPPGSELIRYAGLDPGMGAEAALSHVIVDLVELADSVEVVRYGNSILAIFSEPKVDTEFARFKMVLGSLTSCVAGSLLAFVLDSPVKFEGEEDENGKVRARFSMVVGSG